MQSSWMMDLSIISLGGIDNGQLMCIILSPIGTWLNLIILIAKVIRGDNNNVCKGLFSQPMWG